MSGDAVSAYPPELLAEEVRRLKIGLLKIRDRELSAMVVDLGDPGLIALIDKILGSRPEGPPADAGATCVCERCGRCRASVCSAHQPIAGMLANARSEGATLMSKALLLALDGALRSCIDLRVLRALEDVGKVARKVARKVMRDLG